MNFFKNYLGIPLALTLIFISCQPIDVFEKNALIPHQAWESDFKPIFTFDITDTASRYNIYIVLRHTNKYEFNNIWLKGSVLQPGDTVERSQQYNLILATNDKGWLGAGMDDVFEHRIAIQRETRFRIPGKYVFTIEQIMREDPLQHVMNAGLRVEKIQ